jgi:thioredoxin 1
MKRFFISAFILLLAGGPAAQAELPAGWSTNYAATLAGAKSSQQPLLLYFTASWCGPCRMMANRTFVDPAVMRALDNYRRVAIDIDQQPALAEARGVRGIPAFFVLSPAGDQVASTTGFQEPSQFLQWLTNSHAGVEAARARQERMERQLAAAERSLQGGTAPGKRQALLELLAACAESGSVPAPVATKLSALAQTDPGLLVEALADVHLAVRIQVANLLRKRAGEEFDIDPWSDAATRQKAITVWRPKLASLPPAPRGARAVEAETR